LLAAPRASAGAARARRVGFRPEQQIGPRRPRRSRQREQDGSEVRSVELERLVAPGLALIERRSSFEYMRDAAIDLHAIHTGGV
jgi:hypothetical protein